MEGTHAYGVTNGKGILTSNVNIDTSLYNNVTMTLRLASFSINTNGNGAETDDIVTVEVSPDGGTNWYSTVVVSGSNNARWSYSGGKGNASTVYDGNTAPVIFKPSGSGTLTADGYSTITITGLPSITNLRFKITMENNNANERWLVDDFKLTGIVNSTELVDWANINDPIEGSIPTGDPFIVNSLVEKLGVTGNGNSHAGINAWIGYNTTNADPTAGGWTWVAATRDTTYTGVLSDRYTADIGTGRTAGTYYYVARYQVQGSSGYYYGGHSNNPKSGGLWNGVDILSGY